MQESDEQRHNRELIELLNELRVALPGVQVLFAFLLAVPFANGFPKLDRLDRDIFCVIEQDLYPVAPDVPLPIAARTAGYFVACGLGPVRRWPYGRNP